jgi:hypothetical protein
MKKLKIIIDNKETEINVDDQDVETLVKVVWTFGK